MKQFLRAALCLVVSACVVGDEPEPSDNNNGSDNNGAATNNGEPVRTNTQGCYAAESCNDDVEAACLRFKDNYYACVELAFEGDPDRIAQEKAGHEDACDQLKGLFNDKAAESFHCQADAFGAADCGTTEGFNQVVSESQGC